MDDALKRRVEEAFREAGVYEVDIREARHLVVSVALRLVQEERERADANNQDANKMTLAYEAMSERAEAADREKDATIRDCENAVAAARRERDKMRTEKVAAESRLQMHHGLYSYACTVCTPVARQTKGEE